MHFSAPSSDDTNLLSWPMHTVCIQSHMVNTVMCFGARTEAMCVFLLSFWKAMPNVLTKVPVFGMSTHVIGDHACMSKETADHMRVVLIFPRAFFSDNAIFRRKGSLHLCAGAPCKRKVLCPSTAECLHKHI